jgi:hypothetical protein
MSHKQSTILHWSIAGMIVMLYLMPFVILGENGRYMVWDNLDGAHVIYKTLLESGQLFGPNAAIIDRMMLDTPRASLPSEFSLTVLLYYILGPIKAYIAIRVIITVFAFVGMYLFLKNNLLVNDCPEYIPIGTATCFSILPFWPYGELSIAGLPLLFHCFLDIRKGKRHWAKWLYIVFYPFFSSLFLSGIFVLPLFGALALIDAAKHRKSAWNEFVALVCLCSAYVFTNYRLFSVFLFDSQYVSHRAEFGAIERHNLQGVFEKAFELLRYGQPHAESIHAWVVLPTIIAGLAITAARRLPTRNLLFGAAFLLFASILYGLADAKVFALIDAWIRSLVPVQYKRAYWLMPVVWYTLFGICLFHISKAVAVGKIIAALILVTQVIVLFANNDPLKAELQVRQGSAIRPTYKQFYAVEQFREIAQAIGMPFSNYRVASIGIHPAIALYNGFSTIDGYLSDYPLDYKHRFRKVIEKELDKNANLKRYFDLWGSRAYIFTSQNLGQLNTKWQQRPQITNLELNTQALKRMNVQFIFSANQIDLQTSPGYELLGLFTSESSAWNIWVYSVK